MTEDNKTTGLTMAQIAAARDAGPRMLEILAGWIYAEGKLCAKGISFRTKLQAAEDLRGLHSSAEALVARVLNAEEGENAGQ